MVRNLPTTLMQDDLLEKLDEAGFRGLYDFVYMPQSFDEREAKGYAFVNFESPAVAGTFMGAWHKSRQWGERCAQSINISPADVQGLEANKKKWSGPRMSRIKNPRFRPWVKGERCQNTSSSVPQETTSKSCSTSSKAIAAQAGKAAVSNGMPTTLGHLLAPPSSQSGATKRGEAHEVSRTAPQQLRSRLNLNRLGRRSARSQVMAAAGVPVRGFVAGLRHAALAPLLGHGIC